MEKRAFVLGGETFHATPLTFTQMAAIGPRLGKALTLEPTEEQIEAQREVIATAINGQPGHEKLPELRVTYWELRRACQEIGLASGLLVATKAPSDGGAEPPGE